MMTFMRKDQEMLLELLHQFGAVSELQARKILKFKFPAVKLERTICPLLAAKSIRRSNGFLFSLSGKLDDRIVEALDIMLLIGPDPGESFIRGSDPIALTFFKWRQEKLWRYDICPVAYGTEPAITARLETLTAKFRMIVFVLEKEEQMQGLHVNCEHCYVLKNNGEYEFYVRQMKENENYGF